MRVRVRVRVRFRVRVRIRVRVRVRVRVKARATARARVRVRVPGTTRMESERSQPGHVATHQTRRSCGLGTPALCVATTASPVMAITAS